VKQQLGDTKDAFKAKKRPDPNIKPYAFQGLSAKVWYEAWIVTRGEDGKNVITPLGVLGDDLTKALTDAKVVLPAEAGKMHDWFFQTNPGQRENARLKPLTTYGSVTITGAAIFYQGLTQADLLKLNFQRGNKINIKLGSGNLLSYRMNVKGNVDLIEKALAKYKVLSETVSRELKAEWDPAKKGGETTVTKTVKP